MSNGECSPRECLLQEERTLRPEEVTAIVELHRLGWGSKRIAAEFGCARNTVKRYLESPTLGSNV